jgi:hypothetical protein
LTGGRSEGNNTGVFSRRRLGATPESPPPARGWWRRFGVLGGLFFFVKGLLWLLLPALMMAWQSLKD